MEEEIFKYCIYKITNNLNGKIYIGQHKLRKKEAPREYMGKGIAIQEAYKKYGRANFKKEIIEYIYDNEKHEKVSEREIFWIKKLNSKYPNGYNISDGGEGGCTKESARKGAATRKSNGYTHSEETKRKISEAHKGIKFTKEHKKHLSEHHHSIKEWTILFEDGHKEKYEGSLCTLCDKYNTNFNTLIRHSKKEEFVNGIMLTDLDFDAYACNKKYVHKYENKKCLDPIKNDICTYKALRTRIFRNKEIYKEINIENCIITEDKKQ